MSHTNAVPGFKPIPAELLNTPKPCLMSANQLRRTLDQLLDMGLIESVVEDGEICFRPTQKGLRFMRRSA